MHIPFINWMYLRKSCLCYCYSDIDCWNLQCGFIHFFSYHMTFFNYFVKKNIYNQFFIYYMVHLKSIDAEKFWKFPKMNRNFTNVRFFIRTLFSFNRTLSDVNENTLKYYSLFILKAKILQLIPSFSTKPKRLFLFNHAQPHQIVSPNEARNKNAHIIFRLSINRKTIRKHLVWKSDWIEFN